ncbi:hypothetical protein TNIN_477921 [Trichonephila inaurata madagascariensis]|uniref:Uncharacterized protein n=1 Tax=Trichonephila inaurata madagascariensis TaxID=2747483 RepID=A0A8X7C4Y0_9ARAC|nr:hypothetical protein TNIN_477921 [Trichonephila inaurata madagascariensis]
MSRMVVSRLWQHRHRVQSLGVIIPEEDWVADPKCSNPFLTTVEERIPIVHSFTVWKMCQALDLKAKFVPLPGATDLPGTPHRGVDQTTTIPVVGSLSVWKICQALDLPATYNPQLIKTTVFRKPNKPVPVVHSPAVFELCKALNLKAKMAPQYMRA